MVLAFRSHYFILISVLFGLLICFFSCSYFNESWLSQEEEEWLKENVNDIKVLMDMTPPYAFLDENGEYKGLAVDYCEELEKHLGIDFNFAHMETWADLIVYAQEHDDYIVAGIARTKNREEYMNFTNAFVKAPYVIVAQKGSSIRTMEDLIGKKVGTVRSYAVNDFLLENYSALDYYYVDDNLQGLLDVSSNELDAMIINRMLATYQIEEQAIINLTAVGDANYYNPLGMGVSMDNQELFRIIDKAVDRIGPKKEREIYLKWVNINSSIISAKVLRIILIVALAVFIGYVMMVSWLRSLREQVNKKTVELLSAKEKAEESDRLKSAFLANMSHEIRTPLNGIIGFTRLLEEPELSIDSRKEYIEYINECGDRMLNTINDLIDISHIETGQVVVNLGHVELKSKLESLYRYFESLAEQKGISFIYHTDIKEDQFFVILDESKLESIITNLLNNAIKFTNKGSVTFSCFLNGEILRIVVEDTGVGIPKDRLEAIFNRFEQADIEDKMAKQGSGLGLAITKSYLEILGGDMIVESKISEGSIFVCTIPIEQVD